jgi:aconitate hydratase
MASSIDPAMFVKSYGNVFDGNPTWNAIPVSGGEAFAWDTTSTYIQEPPFFLDLKPALTPLREIHGARVLGIFGDGITTDHISPAGGIAKNSPAARYLMERGVEPKNFNQYGTRRGNHEVMMRGTFANVRIKNLMLPLKADGSRVEGGYTLYKGEQVAIYDAAMKHIADGTPTVIFAGEEYGTGSSRDWAAKGTQLLGVKAVIARSYERIHRSNLVGMGVLPLQFKGSDSAVSLNLTGDETFDLIGINDNLKPQQDVTLIITCKDGSKQNVELLLRIDTPIEVDYYKNGGILPYVLKELVGK